MKSVPLFLLLLFSLFIANNCSLHPPLSESLVFYDPLESDNRFRLLEMGPAIETSFYESKLQNEARKKYGGAFDSVLSTNWKYGLNAYGVSFRFGNRFAVGLAPVSWGMDFTLNLDHAVYLTAAANIYKNFQFTLQRRLLLNSEFGVSVGAFYKQEHQSFHASAPIQWDEIFPVSIAGIRGLYQFKMGRMRMRAITSLGYEFHYSSPVAFLGFSWTFGPREISKGDYH